jgi:hypothetical protein
MVLTACFALFPAIGLFCHRRFAKFIAKLDVSVETSEPRDFAVRCLCRSSFDMAASTASRSQRS